MRLMFMQLRSFGVVGLVLIFLVLVYFLWSFWGLLTFIRLQPQPPSLQATDNFFDKHEKEIEQLREMILDETTACSVGLDRIGRYTRWPDNQWHSYKNTYPVEWTVYPQEHALIDMKITTERYSQYLNLLQQTSLRSVSKSLSGRFQETFDSAHYVNADDDPEYRQRITTTSRESVYVWLDYWHGNTSMGACTLYIVYVPTGSPVPSRLRMHLKENWNLVW